MIFSKILYVLTSAINNGMPVLFGATGEIMTEKSGHLNLGIPGVMAVGGISGVIASFFYQQAESKNSFLMILLPILASLLGSLIMGLIYCFLTVTLRANQNVTGLALTTFGIGIGNFFGASIIKLSNSELSSVRIDETSTLFKKTLPFAEKLGWFGELFLSYRFLVYIAIIIAVVCSFVIMRTRVGLHLRAVGENPATADAAGINVNKYKYVSTCIGSMIAGLGGLFYCIDKNGWANDTIEPLGWIAIALVIFAIWKPNIAIFGAILFGLLLNLYDLIPVLDLNIKFPPGYDKIFKMVPYIVTIIVLIITSARKKRENQPPAHLGLSYFREDR
ncbi:MAG: ABC transporter permease [Clostridia bacterium]|nr:ABC transporter permease [Clostridia bacterium]